MKPKMSKDYFLDILCVCLSSGDSQWPLAITLYINNEFIFLQICARKTRWTCTKHMVPHAKECKKFLRRNLFSEWKIISLIPFETIYYVELVMQWYTYFIYILCSTMFNTIQNIYIKYYAYRHRAKIVYSLYIYCMQH